MVHVCAIPGCTATYDGTETVSLFGVPTIITRQCDRTKELSTQRQALWLSRIGRKFDVNRNDLTRIVKVCNKHFLHGKPSKLFENTHPDWAPSLNLGNNSPSTNRASHQEEHSSGCTIAEARYNRAASRTLKRKAACESENNPGLKRKQKHLKTSTLTEQDDRLSTTDCGRGSPSKAAVSTESLPEDTPTLEKRIVCSDWLQNDIKKRLNECRKQIMEIDMILTRSKALSGENSPEMKAVKYQMIPYSVDLHKAKWKKSRKKKVDPFGHTATATLRTCVFGTCTTDSRFCTTPFLPFPKPCPPVMKKSQIPDDRHIAECHLCRICSRWVASCRRIDNYFSNITHVKKNHYICMLHFVGDEGPNAYYPYPLPAAEAASIKELQQRLGRKGGTSGQTLEQDIILS